MKHDLAAINAALILGDRVVFPVGTRVFVDFVDMYAQVYGAGFVYCGSMWLDILSSYDVEFTPRDRIVYVKKIIYSCRARIPKTTLYLTFDWEDCIKRIKRRKFNVSIHSSYFLEYIPTVAHIPEDSPPFGAWLRIHQEGK
jgi:hypothetical protein